MSKPKTGTIDLPPIPATPPIFEKDLKSENDIFFRTAADYVRANPKSSINPWLTNRMFAGLFVEGGGVREVSEAEIGLPDGLPQREVLF